VEVPEVVAHLVALPEYSGLLETIAKAAAFDNYFTGDWDFYAQLQDDQGNVLWQTEMRDHCGADDND
jgi:hypothetical protein